MDGFLFALTLFAALGCGVVAGVFFAYSAFVMRALARLPAQQGIAAMQAINVAAVTPVFMAALFGTALACGGLIVSSLLVWGEPFAAYLFIGGALYLAGARAAYEGPWNFWNGVRTVFSSMAFLALIGACLLREDRSLR
jgi:uncharacterized membrane protein